MDSSGQVTTDPLAIIKGVPLIEEVVKSLQEARHGIGVELDLEPVEESE